MGKKYLFLLIIIIVLLTISCSQSVEGNGELSLFILRLDENTKTLATDIVYDTGMDIASYEYKAVCTSNPGAYGTQNSWTPLSVSDNSCTISDMAKGNWTVSVRAKNGNGGVILQGSVSFFLNTSSRRQSITITSNVTDYSVPIPATVTVSVGVTVPSIETESIVMRYTALADIANLNSSGTGGSPITVYSAEDHRTTISGSSISHSTPDYGYTAYYGSASLLPGLYVFQVLYKHESTILSGQMIAVHVQELSPFAINGTLTAGEYISFTITPSVTLNHNIQNLFFSQIPYVSPEGRISASVSTVETITNPVYEWYVNGIPDPGQTGPHYTSSGVYNSGKYAITCIVSGTVNGRDAMGYVTEDIETGPLVNVGGIIFYIDSSATGTYEFYDESGIRVPEPSVGTDCTGWRYRVVSPGNSRDKFYVYNENAIVKAGGSGDYNSPYVAWTYLDEKNASYSSNSSNAGYRGRVFDSKVNTSEGIGTGRANTHNVMSIIRNVKLNNTVLKKVNAYIQGRWYRWRGESEYSETIWYVCDEFNNGTYWRFANNTGCDDWFIPSIEEVSQFRNHFASASAFVTMTSSVDLPYTVLWSSSANSFYDYAAYCWIVYSEPNYDQRNSEYRYNGYTYTALVLVRAF